VSEFIEHESIQDETVRKVCENFQYLDMGIFVHILSGRTFVSRINGKNDAVYYSATKNKNV